MPCVNQGLQQQNDLLSARAADVLSVSASEAVLPNEATDSDICHSHSTDGHFWKSTFIGKDVYKGDKIFSWIVVKMFPAASSQKIYSFQFEFSIIQ